MSDAKASLRFDEPIEGQVTQPLSEAALSRSTAGIPATAVMHQAGGSDVDGAGFQPGMQIGTYRLINKLGEGGMGIVYKAMHTKLDKVVAIKLLPMSMLAQRSTLARFELEMKVVGRLEHPNIVQAFDAGEVNGTHFLVMEYVEGTDLQRLVMLRGVLTVDNACKAIYQAALGLHAAHEAGVFHRDIKPSNLFVTKTGQIKILDLGLARLNEDDGEKSVLTQSGQVFGTPEYMAPEQWEDVHTCDGRTDLYALGCTLFFLLAGRPPYGGDEYKTAPRKMLGHINDPIPSLKQLRSDVPADLEAIYRKLMAKQAADRFPSAKELADALSAWIDGGAGLTHLPLSTSSPANPAAKTIADRTRAEQSQPPNSDLTEGAGIPVDQLSPTVMGPVPGDDPTKALDDPRGERSRPPTSAPRRKWLWPALGGVAALLLVVSAASRFIPGRATPTVPGGATQAGGAPTENNGPQNEPSPAHSTIDPMPPTGLPDVFVDRRVALTPWSEFVRRSALVESAPDLPPQPPATFELPAENGLIVLSTMSWDIAAAPEVLREAAFRVGRPDSRFGNPPDELPVGPRPLKAPFTVAEIQESQAAWAQELNLDRSEFENGIGMDLVLIPPGEYSRGPANQSYRVELTRPFLVGKYEVTQSEYQKVMQTNPSRYSSKGMFASLVAKVDTNRLPVDSVSWNDAIDFCNRLSELEGRKPYYTAGGKIQEPETNGYRLLTEAEWEYVCRAGTDSNFAFGRNLTSKLANVDDSKSKGEKLNRPQPVGEYPANPFGVHDMHGNLYEWCYDFYDENYVKKPAKNPQGPASGKFRVYRGGAFSRSPDFAQSHVRYYLKQGDSPRDSGFRVARHP